MTFGSLFSGIGGLDFGLERAGMECRWQIEIDDFCRRVLAKHWPGVKRYADIRTVRGEELEPVDLICGGYPCQPFSVAGKRRGEDDARHLWPEFARILRILRPRFALLENVPGHLVLGFGRVLWDLARLGFDAEWTCLRASDFGAAHLRKRVFVVAYRSGPGRSEDARSTSADETADGGKRWDECEPHSDHQPSGKGAGMADAAPGGRRELRESSGERRRQPYGGNPQLADSESARFDGREGTGLQRDGSALSTARSELSDGHMEDAGCGGRGRAAQPAGIDGRGSPDHNCGASGALDDADLDGAQRTGRTELLASSGCEELEDAARNEQPGLPGEDGRLRGRGVRETGESVADAGDGFLPLPQRRPQGRDGPGSAGPAVSDSECAGLPDAEQTQLPGAQRDEQGRTASELCGAFAPGPGDSRWGEIIRQRPDLAPALGGRLGPRFVEFLMGFPIGFTEVKDDLSVMRRITKKRSEQILQSDLHRLGQAQEGIEAEFYSSSDTAIQKISMRTMRIDREAVGYPSQGPGLEEQRSDEPTNAVRKLSCLVASCRRGDCSALRLEAVQIVRSPALQEKYLQHLSNEDQKAWAELCDEDREDCLVEAIAWAAGMTNRTKRLSRLGNAVVPQVAEYIGRKILEFAS